MVLPKFASCRPVWRKKHKIIAGQQYGSAAVRTVVKDRGVQQRGRWYSQAPVGGRYFRSKKKFISHRTKKDSHVRNGPPTHHGRRSAPSTHPPTKPLLHSSVQQCSSTYSSTPGTRGAVGWFLRILYEIGNKRGEFHFLTILGHLGERASRHPPPAHHPTSTHGPTQYSSTAMQLYVEQYT